MEQFVKDVDLYDLRATSEAIAAAARDLAKRIEESRKPVAITPEYGPAPEQRPWYCNTCGASVFDKELHSQWHRDSVKEKS